MVKYSLALKLGVMTAMKSPKEVAKLVADKRNRSSKVKLNLTSEAWYAQAHDRYSIVKRRVQLPVSLRDFFAQAKMLKILNDK